jgi:hypothetical protein
VYSIVSSAGAEVRKVVETQMEEGNNKAAQFVEFAAKNAPAGSEPVVSMLKNAVAVCNTAYDTLSKAAMQAFEAAESNLSAATQAAVSAVTHETDVVKTKSKKAE